MAGNHGSRNDDQLGSHYLVTPPPKYTSPHSTSPRFPPPAIVHQSLPPLSPPVPMYSSPTASSSSSTLVSMPSIDDEKHHPSNSTDRKEVWNRQPEQPVEPIRYKHEPSPWLVKQSNKKKSMNRIVFVLAIIIFGSAAVAVAWHLTHSASSPDTLPTVHNFSLGGTSRTSNQTSSPT